MACLSAVYVCSHRAIVGCDSRGDFVSAWALTVNINEREKKKGKERRKKEGERNRGENKGMKS